ncbi:S8 family serine peptidase [Leptothrix sp. BB-3]
MSDEGGNSGLTGKGVWIGVIDDFTTTHDAVFRFPSLTRQKVTKAATTSSTSSGSTTTTTCSLPHEWSTKWTHGELVEQISGGKSSEQTRAVTLALTNYTVNPSCVDKFYASLSVGLEAQLKIASTAGVASGASVQRYPVVLGTTKDAKQQLGTILGHLSNALSDPQHSIRVVNMSLGSEIGASSVTRTAVIESAVRDFPIATAVDAVITVAAGNSGLPCAVENLLGCNLVAVAMLSQDTSKNSTIVVGALEGVGRAQKIPTYSNLPGYLANSFLWASGDSDTLPVGGDGWAQGTSFAAPRVAGAAALLRGKYPSLTSEEIVSLLLDSADRDMDNDGIPDFKGASQTWGRGKLSLGNALKLAAERYPDK